jgi:hypothetical protein
MVLETSSEVILKTIGEINKFSKGVA